MKYLTNAIPDKIDSAIKEYYTTNDTKLEEICKKHEITRASFYFWTKKMGINKYSFVKKPEEPKKTQKINKIKKITVRKV